MYKIGSAFHTASLLLHFPPLHVWPYRIFHSHIFSRPLHELARQRKETRLYEWQSTTRMGKSRRKVSVTVSVKFHDLQLKHAR